MRPAATALLLALLPTAPAPAQQPAPTAATPPPAAGAPTETPPAPAESTTVKGTLPDLAGRWLLLMRLATTPGQAAVQVLRFLDVRAGEGGLQVSDRSVGLPQAMAERQKKPGGSWAPSAEDLKELAAAWDDLPVQERWLSSIAIELNGSDQFDDVLSKEPTTKDARWALRETFLYREGTGRPAREFTAIGAREQTPAGWTGTAALVILAMAPFPVPIALRGDFDLYRIETPARGFLSRLGAIFSGCGRLDD